MRVLLILLVGVSVSCSSLKNRDAITIDSEQKNQTTVTNEPLDAYHIDRVKLNQNEEEDIPIEVNRQVLKWIQYFQGRGKAHMTRYLARSAKYAPVMREILQSHNMPEELVYLALIESGFNPHAVSSANAVGYWQFIKATGKHYGLTINSSLDERRDPIRSTEAAAKYLKALYNLFGDWYLAIASYNSGENRIKRLVMRNYTRNFWELAKKKQLPRETQNYVPKFIAATLIARDPVKYGFTNIENKPVYRYEAIEYNFPISLRKLSQKMGLNYKVLKDLNPAIRSEIVSKNRRGFYEFKVPVGSSSLAQQVVAHAKVSARQVRVASSTKYYRVRKGDNLSSIAGKFGTSVSHLKRLNRLGRKSVIYSGTRLKVPGSSKLSARARNELRSYSSSYHKVQKGESLIYIARKYGVSLGSLRKANHLGRRSLIRIGSNLKIPGKTQSTAHKVRRGESLIYLANKYGVTLSQLARANSLSTRAKIQIGETLTIPH